MENKTDIEISRELFYQSKYDYYRSYNFWVVVAGCLSSLTYFISDCQLFGRFAIETLFARFNILIPMALFIMAAKKIRKYKVMVSLSYLLGHWIMWNTIWAIYFLPDRSHASEGFIVMQLLFFALGFAAPFHYSTTAHLLLIGDILISNCFNHYQNLDIILSLSLPATLAVIVVHFSMQKYYLDHYKTALNLEFISKHDFLTQTYNRNRINELIDSETHTKFLPELGNKICVIMFDIDFFKNVNDTYGHMAGDSILQKLCSCIKDNINWENDFIRWGGEEFLIVLRDCPISEGINIAERLRIAVSKMQTDVCPITISVGISCYDGIDYKRVVSSADKALYLAKKCGRNCVKFFEQ